GEVELAKVFAEEGLCSFSKAVDGERAALAEVDLVGVHLEDLLLVEARLELVRDHDLFELALLRAGRSEKEAPRELHGERRAAAGPPFVEGIDDSAFEQTR